MDRDRQPTLHEVARAYGLQTGYADNRGGRHQASRESLLAVLKALGAPVASPGDLRDALRNRRRAIAERAIEPVIVVWDGKETEWRLRLPEGTPAARIQCTLRLEEGEQRRWTLDPESLAVTDAAQADGIHFLTHKALLPAGLPHGYHRLELEFPGRGTPPRQASALVISAPERAYAPPRALGQKTWGLFLPLYALWSNRSAGVGDLGDLERLTEWTRELGGTFVATLPMLATYLDEPLEYSPYAPVSRLFWNELFIDLDSAMAMLPCPAAESTAASSKFQQAARRLREMPEVEYRQAMALKRGVLQDLARCFFSHGGENDPRFQRFLQGAPLVEDYARFRAVVERRRATWQAWPQPLRDGIIAPGDYAEETRQYHRFVQWLVHEQFAALAEKARDRGLGLYLDLPLGVYSGGFDTWKERNLFSWGVAAGAPPDDFFTHGQCWGFPPLHPEHIREDGYRHCIAYLRNHLRHAGVLRVDHVMNFHRLFWVPDGMPATEGVYMRYRPEEFYAIVCLESHRTHSLVVGENLGTVPQAVDRALARHGIYGMYAGQFQVTDNPRQAVDPVGQGVVASLNTHDAPPFAAFWHGVDLDDRVRLGLLRPSDARRERRARERVRRALTAFLEKHGSLHSQEPDDHALLMAWLAYLSTSRATIVVVNLEDLWLEVRRQNMPGTGSEQPNWKRKARYNLEAFQQLPDVIASLRTIDRLRHQGEK